ncbi:universal stress protein [Oculatella sp. LEGE 06141]|uniref:universal stress protein n=1 Tax=Oculatella sp. LEGE 06141 TaxID=1828648 RepID=UPI00187FDC32|nr:universal stress protein [Oculatella sp. LEGE 06141]MBE9179616.1 universal stress protein [Oculatella sp. LEGE 06141]
MEPKKIVVAIDRSPQAPLVFEQAVQQAQCSESRLLLLHSVRDESLQTGPFLGVGTIGDVATYGALQRSHQDHLHQQLVKAEAWLQSYCQQAHDHGILAECSCKAGEPASWICDVAHDWGANLIVLGRRGHKGLTEIVLGSVSNYVIHHAPCSVLVVQGTSSPHT